ncbi:acetyl-CoA acetyltransferase [compost metagenome]
MFYDRAGAPKHGVIVARTPDHARFLAYVPADDAAIDLLTSGRTEPVGARGAATRRDDGLVVWRS